MATIDEQERLLRTFAEVLGPKGIGWAAAVLHTPRSRAAQIVERARINCSDRQTALASLLLQAEQILDDVSTLARILICFIDFCSTTA